MIEKKDDEEEEEEEIDLSQMGHVNFLLISFFLSPKNRYKKRKKDIARQSVIDSNRCS